VYRRESLACLGDEHPMLDAESRVLAQTRVTECERVLAGLDAGIAGHQDAI